DEVSTAEQALQQKLGNSAPTDTGALTQAIQAVLKDNDSSGAALTLDQLQRAAVALVAQYNVDHPQPSGAGTKVDPFAQAVSEVALTHQFANMQSLTAAGQAFTDGPLPADKTTNDFGRPIAPRSVDQIHDDLQHDMAAGMTLREAVNLELVQAGGGAQNDPNLAEASLMIKGDALVGTTKGDILKAAQSALESEHIFTTDVSQAAAKALSTTVTPTSGLNGATQQVRQAYGTLQHDQAAHASAEQLAQDEQRYHTALSGQLNAAAGDSTGSWTQNLVQIDRRWQAEQTVQGLDTGDGGPSAGDLHTSLQAAQALDVVQAARGSGDAAGNAAGAKALSSQLQGVAPTSALYQEVMSDGRVSGPQGLQAGALQDIVSAHGKDAGDAGQTLAAQAQALSQYKGTPLYDALVKGTLASPQTQQAIQSVKVPGSLNDMAALFNPIGANSQELAGALFDRLKQPLQKLIEAGDQDASRTGDDTYYKPLAQIGQSVGLKTAAGQQLTAMAKAELEKLAQQPRVKPATGAAANYEVPTPQAFDTFALAAQDGTPMELYQTILDQDQGNGQLTTLLQQGTGLKPTPTPGGTAPQDAAQLSTALTALNGADSQTLSQKLADGRKANPAISDATWAQAALLQQAQVEVNDWAQQNKDAIAAGSAGTPPDPLIKAQQDLSNDQLFDAQTLQGAKDALENGQVAAAATGDKKAPGLQSGADTVQYLREMLGEGLPPKAALMAARAWLGGGSGTEQSLMQAALTVMGQQYVQTKYDGSANAQDPIQWAKDQLTDLKVFDAGQLSDLAGKMTQNPKPDTQALQKALDQAQTDLGKAQQAPAGSDDKAKALQAYHADLAAALNAAAGQKDGAWQTDPNNVDTLWKAQVQVQQAVLMPVAEQYGTDSDQFKQAAQQLGTAMGAQQVLAHIEQAQQAAGGAQTGNEAAAEALTRQLQGLKSDNPLYQEVMGDATVKGIAATALNAITSGAAEPMMCTVDDPSGKSVLERLKSVGTQLQAYSNTMLYPQLVDGATNDAQVQTLFGEVDAQVRGNGKPQDKLNALSDAMLAAGPDLSAALFDSKFKSGDVVQWTQQANDLTGAAKIYVHGGGANNPAMVQLRHDIEGLLNKPMDKGGIGNESEDSNLNVQVIAAEDVAVVYGQDFGLSAVTKKGDVPLELVQDIIEEGPKASGADASNTANADVIKELERETGYKPKGTLPAQASQAPQVSDDAPWQPGREMQTAGKNLIGLQSQDGLHVDTTYDRVLNEIGAAENPGKTPTYVPQTLAQQQALTQGQFAEYDPKEVVYDSGGRKTTLGQIVDQVLAGAGAKQPSAVMPVELTSLSMEWWNNREGKGQGSQLAIVEGLDAQGREMEVGPADTTVRHGYSDWQSHAGLNKGLLIAQPHWVLGADGSVLSDDAYWKQFKPDDHWWNKEYWVRDAELAGTFAMAAFTAFVPATAPVLALAISDAIDAYFTIQAVQGAWSAYKNLTSGKEGGWRNAWNWVDLGANVLG
ncbi:hypothetical protein C0Z18_32290, partial [Trinickia dabaoshanensis]